jgi:pimeloyl-ACP methyl ester carboxylesterase
MAGLAAPPAGRRRTVSSGLEAVAGGPAHLVGCGDGAIVALLAALRRPDLVRQLVCVAGVFHRDGWGPGVIDPDQAPPDFIADMYAELSPDGAAHFPVVTAKLARMYAAEPTLTGPDLQQVTGRTMVMVGDDDEVTLEHAVDFCRHRPTWCTRDGRRTAAAGAGRPPAQAAARRPASGSFFARNSV